MIQLVPKALNNVPNCLIRFKLVETSLEVLKFKKHVKKSLRLF